MTGKRPSKQEALEKIRGAKQAGSHDDELRSLILRQSKPITILCRSMEEWLKFSQMLVKTISSIASISSCWYLQSLRLTCPLMCFKFKSINIYKSFGAETESRA
jgi:hypothetical protein